MKIWLLTIGEPIPQDGENTRLLRTGQFATWLAEQGHDVSFFNSTVDHYQRKQRFNETTVLPISDNYRVICLKARLYKRSFMPDRFLSHWDVAKSFRTFIETEKPEIPDVILASYPIEELCREVINYAAENNIPVAIDCRDLWPDIFHEFLPLVIRWVGPILFSPFEYRAKKTLSRADAIVGMTKSMQGWGLTKADRELNELDFVFPFTYSSSDNEKINVSIENSTGKVQICFIGTLSKRSGLDKVILAASKLSESEKELLQITIAGTGDHHTYLEKLAIENNAPVKFVGWLDATQIKQLLDASDLALLAYHLPDFHYTLPNKFSEYLSRGIPIFSCTEGEVRSFIEKHECGIWVEPKEEAIINGLKLLIENKPTEEFSNRALKAFNENFSQDRVFEDVLFKLQKLISNENSTPITS